jgi:hypothetical protein
LLSALRGKIYRMTSKLDIKDTSMTLRWITQRLQAERPAAQYAIMWDPSIFGRCAQFGS